MVVSSLLTRGFSFWQSAAAVFAYVSGIPVSWEVTGIVVRNRHTGHTSLQNYSWIAISETQNTFAVMVAIVWWCSLSCGVPAHSSGKSLRRIPHAWTLGSSCLLLSHSYPEGQKRGGQVTLFSSLRAEEISASICPKVSSYRVLYPRKSDMTVLPKSFYNGLYPAIEMEKSAYIFKRGPQTQKISVAL